MAGAHKKLHPINDSANHSPGVNNTVVATVTGAITDKTFGVGAVAGTLVDRDTGGHINGVAGATGNQLITAGDADLKVAAAIDGLSYKAPVAVANLISDNTSAPPGGPATGDAYVLNAAGTGAWVAFSDGDLVVWDGAAWQLVVANAAGSPPLGTRALVTGLANGVGAGGLAGQDLNIATADGAGGWTFEAPLDGWTVLVAGDGDPIENSRLSFDTAPASWNLSQSSVAHNATTGLQGGTAGEFYHLSQADFNLSINRRPNIALAGTEPIPGDLTSLPNNGDWAYCQGTGGAIFHCTRIGASFFGVELTLLS